MSGCREYIVVENKYSVCFYVHVSNIFLVTVNVKVELKSGLAKPNGGNL
jgi:hypothetical protein